MKLDMHGLGFDPFFEAQFSKEPLAGTAPARIVAEHRGAYTVAADSGTGSARLAGRLYHALSEAALPGVGDWVGLNGRPGPDQATVITGLAERRTAFVRGAAGRETRAQVVAANVDLVFAVSGLDGDFNLRRIERYLARIWASGALPVVLLNKADLCAETDLRALEVEAVCPGVEVLVLSAREQVGLESIRARIPAGQTAALVGSSGVGKSTLINALLGEEHMATGPVRNSDDRGRHVTSHRQLLPLPGGGLLIDTPGMRSLELVDGDGLDAVFSDIEALAEGCRFSDCRHDTEPGCAVKAAVEVGELPAERLESYRKLEREARAFALRHDEHARRKSERVWGQLSDEAALIRKLKRES